MTPDGWLKSGDIGRCNTDGLFWCTDRKKEMIKVSRRLPSALRYLLKENALDFTQVRGFQVSPADLEGVLLTHPKVIDAAVTRGFAETTELPVAFVVASSEDRNAETALEIQKYVDGQVSAYKRLAGGIIFTDVIEKNASGKVRL